MTHVHDILVPKHFVKGISFCFKFYKKKDHFLINPISWTISTLWHIFHLLIHSLLSRELRIHRIFIKIFSSLAEQFLCIIWHFMRMFYNHLLQYLIHFCERLKVSYIYIYFLLIICTNGWSIPTIINVSPTLPTYMIHKCYAAGNCFTLMLDGHSSTTEMASTYSELSMAAH